MSGSGSKIQQFLFRQKFRPGLAGLLINPFYFARKGLYDHIVQLAPSMKGRALDIGCGFKPYEDLFPVEEYVGLEIDSGDNRAGKKADLFYDGKTFPIESGKFDSVITSQVLEHVFNPAEFLSEINRVLKDGGYLLLTVPFVWDEHEQPFDYARYSSFGLKHLLHKHGFEVVMFKKSVQDIRVIFQMLNAYFYKKLITKHRMLNILAMVFIMAPVNVLGAVLGFITPKNEDLYLDNIVLARKKS